MLVHHRPKVGNYVSSCCAGMNYYYTVYLKYLNMNTQEQQIFDYMSGNCTPGRWSDSDRCLTATAWASCCIFSEKQHLAAIAWESCCLLFVISSEMSESLFLKILYSGKIWQALNLVISVKTSYF